MPLKLTTYYRGSKVPDLPGTNTFHSTELFRIYEATPGIPPYSLWHPKMTSPLRNCLPPYVKVSACFHPASSKDVRCTVRENISITRQTKRLSSVTCCKGLPMKHCAILFSSSSATWKMPCSDTNLSGTTIHRHQLAAGAQLAAQRRKGGRAFQPVTYPANKERAQKRRPSAGSTYQRGDSLFCPDVAPRIFFQDTAPLPQHQVLSASRKPVDKRAAKQNLHRHL